MIGKQKVNLSFFNLNLSAFLYNLKSNFNSENAMLQQVQIICDRLGDHEKAFENLGSGFLMTYTFKRKLMFTNKTPRRIDRRSGARNKKIILKSYQKIIKGKKNK